MATKFETVEGSVFGGYYAPTVGKWAVKGVKLESSDTEVDAFAIASLDEDARRYPRILRLGILKDETLVKDFVWRAPNGNVAVHTIPRIIDDFHDFFRGEPHAWQELYRDDTARSIRRIYGDVVRGGSVDIWGHTFTPQGPLPIETLGTPPTYEQLV